MTEKYFINTERGDGLKEEADAFSQKFSRKFSALMLRALRDAQDGRTGLLEMIRAQRSIVPDDIERSPSREFSLTMRDGAKIRARLHFPSDEDEGNTGSSAPRLRSALLYSHGGGWTIGSVDSCEGACSEICRAANCPVLSYDYRLAPEYPYPTPQNDAEDVFQWLSQNAERFAVDRNKIFVGGDSAGGHISISLALKLNEKNAKGQKIPPPRGMILYYPVASFCEYENYESWKLYGEGLPLDATNMEEFHSCYIREKALMKKLSPLFSDRLGTLPPFVLLASERDILRDGAEKFAERARSEGVRCRVVRMNGATHIYMTMPAMRRAFDIGVEEAARFIAQMK